MYRWFTNAFLGVVAVAGLSACTLIPGNHAYTMRTESAVTLPVKQGEDTVMSRVKVTPITAELIVQQEVRLAQLVNPTRNGEPTPLPGVQYEDYRLGPGDIINVIVWDYPELTTPAGIYRSAAESGNLVAEDGTIFFPYAGLVHVAGKSLREVRQLLAERLSKVIEKVQLDVRVAAFRSKRVYVVGEVAKPGLQEINDLPMTILEAINRSGGFSKEADHSGVLLTRAGNTYRVDVQALYEFGAVNQNILLLPGDIINVPDRQFNKVFVLGEVANQGSQLMNRRRVSLAEALADAGYINQNSANPAWIFVMRGGVDEPELFHLDSLSPDALLLADRFALQPRDIVYVDAADLARWSRVVNNLLPTMTLLNTTSSVRYPLFNGRQ